jgi:hypothetical protein
MKKIYLIAITCILVLAGCAGNGTKQPPINLYTYTGDLSAAAIIEPSDLTEMDGVIKQQGRAYVAAIDGVQVASKFSDFVNPVKLAAGRRNLTLRYFDGTAVQCQVRIPVTINAGGKYKVVLQSDRSRENIRMTISNTADMTLIEPLTMATRLMHPFNRFSIVPIEERTFSTKNGTGCH